MAGNSYCVVSWTFIVRMYTENVLNILEKQRRVDLPCSELVMDSGGGCGLIHGCCLCGVLEEEEGGDSSDSAAQHKPRADL